MILKGKAPKITNCERSSAREPGEIKLNPCKCGMEPNVKFTVIEDGLYLKIKCPDCQRFIGFTWLDKASVDLVAKAYHKWNAYHGMVKE